MTIMMIRKDKTRREEEQEMRELLKGREGEGKGKGKGKPIVVLNVMAVLSADRPTPSDRLSGPNLAWIAISCNRSIRTDSACHGRLWPGRERQGKES